jgi:hypothetical protein
MQRLMTYSEDTKWVFAPAPSVILPQERTSTDQENLEDEREGMSIAGRNNLGRFWLKKSRELTKTGINLGHPTHSETKRIKDGGEVSVFIQTTVFAFCERFNGCDFEAKEGVMEYW